MEAGKPSPQRISIHIKKTKILIQSHTQSAWAARRRPARTLNRVSNLSSRVSGPLAYLLVFPLSRESLRHRHRNSRPSIVGSARSKVPRKASSRDSCLSPRAAFPNIPRPPDQFSPRPSDRSGISSRVSTISLGGAKFPLLPHFRLPLPLLMPRKRSQTLPIQVTAVFFPRERRSSLSKAPPPLQKKVPRKGLKVLPESRLPRERQVRLGITPRCPTSVRLCQI